MKQHFSRIAIGIMTVAISVTIVACSGGGVSALSPFANGGVATIANATPTSSAAPTATPLAGPVWGPVTFPVPGGSGACPGGLVFSAAGQTAEVSLLEPGYTGTYTASSSDTSIVTATYSAGAVTITTVNSGSATVKVTNSSNESISCPVSVTITGGTVS